MLIYYIVHILTHKHIIISVPCDRSRAHIIVIYRMRRLRTQQYPQNPPYETPLQHNVVVSTRFIINIIIATVLLLFFVGTEKTYSSHTRQKYTITRLLYHDIFQLVHRLLRYSQCAGMYFIVFATRKKLIFISFIFLNFEFGKLLQFYSLM